MDLPDEEYALTEGAGWFEVHGFDIRIHATDEGVVVDVYDHDAMNDDLDAALLTSTYAFSAELRRNAPED